MGRGGGGGGGGGGRDPGPAPPPPPLPPDPALTMALKNKPVTIKSPKDGVVVTQSGLLRRCMWAELPARDCTDLAATDLGSDWAGVVDVQSGPANSPSIRQ